MIGAVTPRVNGSRGQWIRSLDSLAVAAMVFLFALGLASLFAESLLSYDPTVVDLGARNRPPFSNGHVLGTDQLGRDILTRLLYGARVSISVAGLGVLTSGTIGIGLGMLAGYHRGVVGSVIMRITDTQLAFPYLLLALVILYGIGPGFGNLVLVFALISWPSYARVSRGLTLGVLNREFIEAARVLGASSSRIILRHALPNMLRPIGVIAVIGFARMIIGESSLSFLGLGIQPPSPSWGKMIEEGRHHLQEAGWIVVLPGLAILSTALAINILARGIADGDRPRLRVAHSGSEVSVLGSVGSSALQPERSEVSKNQAPDARSDGPEAGSGLPLLEVVDLTVGFVGPTGITPVVREVSFTVDRGEALAIVGESGSGKTVMSKTIMGILPQPPGVILAGSVRFRDRDMLKTAQRDHSLIAGREISMVFQDALESLNPLATVGSQIAEMFRYHCGDNRRVAKERATRTLEEVGIVDVERWYGAYPHQLSGGMRQRVVIGTAVALRPSLIIADEPTTALDTTVQAQVVTLLVALRRELSAGLIFVTHDLALARQLCDRVAVMYAGRIVEAGPIADVLGLPQHPYTFGLVEAHPSGMPHGASRLVPLDGVVPSPGEIPVGCAFAARCSRATSVCEERPPMLTETTRSREVACFHPIVDGA